MNALLNPEQVRRRERTLLAALLLSLWAPLATGLAVMLSSSSTQLADFVRRSVELLALAVAYGVFRRIARGAPLTAEAKIRLESTSGWVVSGALLISGCIMFTLALVRLGSFTPGGNVTLGLVIASLGALVNGWFWRRYAVLNRETHDTVINGQRNLYQAKTMVDFAVILALSAVALWPASPATGYVDSAGSFLVAIYMIWRSLQNARETRVGAGR